MSGDNPTKTSSQDKREALEEFVTIGMAMLHLDARTPGVRVPEFLQNNFQLRLNVSPRFRPFDLVIDEWGVRQTLSFSGRPYPVSIPWVAIYGLSSVRGEMRLYPYSMPDELFETVALSQGKTRSELEKEMRCRERDDGHSPAPVLVFQPIDAPGVAPSPEKSAGASGKVADDGASRTGVAGAFGRSASPGPRPVMMRRKGGLTLVAPPPESESDDSPSETAAHETSGEAPRKAEASEAASVSAAVTEGASTSAAAPEAPQKKAARKRSKAKTAEAEGAAGKENSGEDRGPGQAKGQEGGPDEPPPPKKRPPFLRVVK